ncbi:MAG: Na+/H+ antiporter NhaA [Albidovulum sp.]
MSLAQAIHRFFRHEAAGGIILVSATLLALMVANSSLSEGYHQLLQTKLSILLGGEGLSKPLILWINDGLMAIFFFLIGLELKREIVEGKLKNPRDIILPGMAAVGGMLVPAAIYLVFNWDMPETMHGWAIPAATDIAFAVGILALIGKRAPAALSIFLLTLAILDDMGAILIIALFYTSELHLDYLLLSIIPIIGLWWLNWRGTRRTAPIVMLGIVLWVLVLKSGVHATIAGVITAFFVPLKDRFGKSPLHSIEDNLSPYVMFGIVPIFAFANAGVVLTGLTMADFAQPLTLGIALGLVIGKQIGVLGVTWVMVKAGLARLPHAVTWTHIYGLACLAGIGFTMSLFIGGLTFTDDVHMNHVRLGVLSGSLVSAVLGYLVLRFAPKTAEQATSGPAAKAAVAE